MLFHPVQAPGMIALCFWKTQPPLTPHLLPPHLHPPEQRGGAQGAYGEATMQAEEVREGGVRVQAERKGEVQEEGLERLRVRGGCTE